MPDMTAIAHALTALKAAKDIAETMIGLRDTAAFQGKLLEFQSKIIDANNAAFSAQEERSSLLDRIRDLEKQVADFEAWEAEKQRYELKEVGPRKFAYVLKPNADRAEPPHWICASCYQKTQKSVLQGEEFYGGGWTHICPTCKAKIFIPPTAT
jgi:hypothetical protein